MNIALLDPRVWLAGLVIVFASLATGWHYGVDHERGKVAKAVIKEITVARKVETVATVEVNKVGVDYETKLAAQKKESDDEITTLKKRLARMPATCRVPAAVVRLLDPGTNDVPADSAAGLGTSGTASATDPTCAAELEIAARNYREVCVPNAAQVEAVQRAYNAVRDRFNTKE